MTGTIVTVIGLLFGGFAVTLIAERWWDISMWIAIRSTRRIDDPDQRRVQEDEFLDHLDHVDGPLWRIITSLRLLGAGLLINPPRPRRVTATGIMKTGYSLMAILAAAQMIRNPFNPELSLAFRVACVGMGVAGLVVSGWRIRALTLKT